MSKPFNTYDVALDMKESLEQLENVADLAAHTASGTHLAMRRALRIRLRIIISALCAAM